MTRFYRPFFRGKPTFGINVRNLDDVKTTSSSRKKMISNQLKSQFHLYFYAETLLARLRLVESSVQFYLTNPALRAELGTAQAEDRLRQIDASLIH